MSKMRGNVTVPRRMSVVWMGLENSENNNPQPGQILLCLMNPFLEMRSSGMARAGVLGAFEPVGRKGNVVRCRTVSRPQMWVEKKTKCYFAATNVRQRIRCIFALSLTEPEVNIARLHRGIVCMKRIDKPCHIPLLQYNYRNHFLGLKCVIL